MKPSPSTKGTSCGGSKRRKSPLAVFVITPSANTVTSHTGNTITWPYFLSTLPKSLRSKLDGKKATCRQVNSIMREQGILLITQERNLQSLTMRDLSEIKSLSSDHRAEIRHLVRLSVKQLLPNTRAAKAKSNCSKEATYHAALESTARSIRSEIGRSKGYGRPWVFRSHTKAGKRPTPTMKPITRSRRQNGIPKQQ